MNIDQKIDRILTEYNFDRMSFDEAKKELLDLHNVVVQREQLLLNECSNKDNQYPCINSGICPECSTTTLNQSAC
jgi:hypothetical protein